MLRRDFGEIPGTNRALDRLEERVLADPLGTAEHQGMIDLDLRVLHPLCQPHDDVAAIVFAKDFMNVVEPRLSSCRVARRQCWRAIEIEAGCAVALDPAATRDQAITDQFILAGSPRHLLDRLITVDPSARGN